MHVLSLAEEWRLGTAMTSRKSLDEMAGSSNKGLSFLACGTECKCTANKHAATGTG
jgi:hypothetical protein